ncbi:hypothetical protein OOT55_13470 [Marinimicrobium sp. C6131]|uniref:hypothetical protein n=1 Tax=Marinimicrobium sp. C6131 TaxID=3022676 RepID=UPI00223DBA9B|nr:hypothetical protein [Marinimicrobium sp. C6131]UZJ43659.1 hypothetical protein OOT55_13470 [Marinimicrobium sp. C6131]
MKKSLLILIFMALTSFGCSANESRSLKHSHGIDSEDNEVDEMIQLLSSLKWKIPSYMRHGDICNDFISDLTNSKKSIRIVPPVVEADDWGNVNIQKYIGKCDKNDFTVNEEHKNVKTGGGDSSRISSGKFFYSKDEYAVWDSPNSNSIIFYTGPKYRLSERQIGYVSEGRREGLKKVFVYSGTFYEVEVDSCKKKDSVNESSSPLVSEDDAIRKSSIIDYRGEKYLLLIANIGSKNTYLIRLFDLHNMSIGKNICSAQHINEG